MNDLPSSGGEQRPPASPMRSGLFKFGLAGTVVWLCAGIGLMIWESAPGALKPNEWGDVFAGLFAPVAFLWLVLGFLQQGTELQLSTRALELQVTELKNSVEQQAALVEVSRKQVEATLEEQDRRREADIESTQPRLFVRLAGKSSNPPPLANYDIDVRNEGETITNVGVIFIPPSAGPTRNFYQTLQRGEERRFRFSGSETLDELTMIVSYDDIKNVARQDRFLIRAPEGPGRYHYAQLRVTRLPPG